MSFRVEHSHPGTSKLNVALCDSCNESRILTLVFAIFAVLSLAGGAYLFFHGYGTIPCTLTGIGLGIGGLGLAAAAMLLFIQKNS